ncbi:MAG: hypothetical protein ACTHVE_00085 [Senegalia sp. (in: firmicutes)]|uniref:hypothetical protein n=1 Tax=Senegalia sp. (in: firmicutes) TaxID=1924098 RepID=UPI003F9D7075
MNKIKLIMLLFLILFIQGCNLDIDDGDKIISPDNLNIVLQGTWKVKETRTIEEGLLSKEEKNKILNKDVVFTNEYVFLNDKLIKNPEYKSKSVNAEEYFLYTYKTDIDTLNIDSDKINVIIVTSNNNYFFDIVQIDKKNILLYYQGAFLYLEKTSNNIDHIDIDRNKNDKYLIKDNKKDNENLSSGVLLGLKSSTQDDFNSEISYRTLWISASDKKINPILEIKDLMIPRRSGFWEMKINSYLDSDSIYAHPVEFTDNEISNEKEKYKDKEKKVIHFVSDDYLAIEYININDIDKKAPRYKVLPLDNISIKQGLLLSDIDKYNDKNSYYNSAEDFMISKGYKNLDDLKLNINSKNFTMARRNGYWILKGRLFSSKTVKETYEDFNINVLPTDELINYNELLLSWDYIKSKVPQTIDAYTSPNKDIAIIISNSKIDIYSIENNLLSSKPIKTIQRKEHEEVVMAEWATGSYVELWDGKIRQKLAK